MKIEFDLNLIEVGDDYWTETVSEVIQNVVIDEVTKSVRKMVKEELKKSEKMIQDYVTKLTSVKIKEALNDIKI